MGKLLDANVKKYLIELIHYRWKNENTLQVEIKPVTAGSLDWYSTSTLIDWVTCNKQMFLV